MPGEDFYDVTAMTLMKRADGCCPERTILMVKFEYSYDNGKTWISHNNSKWYTTGSIPADNKDVARKFEIEPKMTGNAFRIIIDNDPKHKVGPYTQGRFDLWALKNAEFVPEKIE